MGIPEDAFEPLLEEHQGDPLAALMQRPAGHPAASACSTGVTVARFHGFDLDDQPLVAGLPQLPHEVVAARSTVALRREMIGCDAVVVFEAGDPYRPIVVGVVQSRRNEVSADVPRKVAIEADGERYVVSAEREIVLRCGEASITLTRAGKVIIKGNYILSRSTGYNKIKGAAIDIN